MSGMGVDMAMKAGEYCVTQRQHSTSSQGDKTQSGSFASHDSVTEAKTGMVMETGPGKTSSVLTGLKNLALRLTYPGRKLLTDLTITNSASSASTQADMMYRAGIWGMKKAAAQGGGRKAQRRCAGICAAAGFLAAIPVYTFKGLVQTPIKAIASIPVSVYHMLTKPADQLSVGLKEADIAFTKGSMKFSDLFHILSAKEPCYYYENRARVLDLALQEGIKFNGLYNDKSLLETYRHMLLKDLYRLGRTFLD